MARAVAAGTSQSHQGQHRTSVLERPVHAAANVRKLRRDWQEALAHLGKGRSAPVRLRDSVMGHGVRDQKHLRLQRLHNVGRLL